MDGRRHWLINGINPARFIGMIAAMTLLMSAASCDPVFPLKRYQIRSNGMYPTIPAGSIIWTQKRPYGAIGEVKRGDIIVFRRRNAEQRTFTDFMWRVVGLPGDSITIQNTTIAIDGTQLSHTLLSRTPEQTLYTEDNGGARYHVAYDTNRRPSARQRVRVVVPPGELFLLGDNRDNAADSRSFGTVKFEHIVAKVIWLKEDVPGQKIEKPHDGQGPGAAGSEKNVR
jgi:signal peptidase I